MSVKAKVSIFAREQPAILLLNSKLRDRKCNLIRNKLPLNINPLVPNVLNIARSTISLISI